MFTFRLLVRGYILYMQGDRIIRCDRNRLEASFFAVLNKLTILNLRGAVGFGNNSCKQSVSHGI